MTKAEALQILTAWRDDLRTTDAKQGKSMMYNLETDAYCCLGRLCVTTGEAIRGQNVPHSEIHPKAYGALKFTPSIGFWWSVNDNTDMTFNEIADILDIELMEMEDDS